MLWQAGNRTTESANHLARHSERSKQGNQAKQSISIMILQSPKVTLRRTVSICMHARMYTTGTRTECDVMRCDAVSMPPVIAACRIRIRIPERGIPSPPPWRKLCQDIAIIIPSRPVLFCPVLSCPVLSYPVPSVPT